MIEADLLIGGDNSVPLSADLNAVVVPNETVQVVEDNLSAGGENNE